MKDRSDRSAAIKRLSASIVEWIDRSELTTRISSRESLILRELLIGLTEPEIAKAHKLSRHTVHAFVKNVYRKLSVRSRPQLMAAAFADILASDGRT